LNNAFRHTGSIIKSEIKKLTYMHNSQVILISAVVAVVALRLYQKFVKKDKSKTGNETKPFSGSSMPSTSKDDDYEPYSKK
jgi:hypothetical protein